MPNSCCSKYFYGGFDNVGHCSVDEVRPRKGCGTLLLNALIYDIEYLSYGANIVIVIIVSAAIFGIQLLALILSLLLGFKVNQTVNQRNAQQKRFNEQKK